MTVGCRRLHPFSSFHADSYFPNTFCAAFPEFEFLSLEVKRMAAIIHLVGRE
jgi:hypothetical protein